MNRRFFGRIDVAINGELVWATKGSFGRVSTHRAYVTTENLSMDGSKIYVEEEHIFPVGSRARIKFGLEFCDVEILAIEPGPPGKTALRVNFITPSMKFISTVESFLPVDNMEDRATYQGNWLGI